MRFILRFVLIGLIGFLCGSYFPQYILWPSMVGAFIIASLFSRRRRKVTYGKKQPPANAFLAGFLALALVWGLSAILKDSANASLLSDKIGSIFDIFLKHEGEWVLPKPTMLSLVTAMIGGLAGGFAAMTGNLFGEAIKS